MKRDTFLSSFWAVGANRCLREWFKENYLLRVAFFFFFGSSLFLFKSWYITHLFLQQHMQLSNTVWHMHKCWLFITNISKCGCCKLHKWFIEKFLQVKVHQISIHFKLHNILNNNLLNIHILTWLNKSHIPKIITTIWVPKKLYFP